MLRQIQDICNFSFVFFEVFLDAGCSSNHLIDLARLVETLTVFTEPKKEPDYYRHFLFF